MGSFLFRVVILCCSRPISLWLCVSRVHSLRVSLSHSLYFFSSYTALFFLHKRPLSPRDFQYYIQEHELRVVAVGLTLPSVVSSSSALMIQFRFVSEAELLVTGPATAKQATEI